MRLDELCFDLLFVVIHICLLARWVGRDQARAKHDPLKNYALAQLWNRESIYQNHTAEINESPCARYGGCCRATKGAIILLFTT